MMKLVVLFTVIASAQASALCQGCSDGLTVAGGAGCYCGTDGLPTTATQFCDTTLAAAGTVMTTARCNGNKADGTTADGTNICSCGTNNLQTPANEFCFVKTDKSGVKTAAAQPACAAAKSTGLVVASAACYCGTANLATTATQFCDTTLVATGTVMTTARCDGNK